MSKYDALCRFLRQVSPDRQEITLTFSEIEKNPGVSVARECPHLSGMVGQSLSTQIPSSRPVVAEGGLESRHSPPAESAGLLSPDPIMPGRETMSDV